MYLALGRGAVGSGRFRSEAYAAARLEQQLADAENECLNHAQCVDIDRGWAVKVSAIFSWRETDFVAAYAEQGAGAVRTEVRSSAPSSPSSSPGC